MPHNKTHKKQGGGSGVAEHGVAVFGGPGQQTAMPGSNVVQVNQPSAVPVPEANVQGGGKRKSRTAKKKPMKKDEGYCLKCKKKRKMVNVKEISIKNKRNNTTRKANKGECSKCGTTMMKFI